MADVADADDRTELPGIATIAIVDDAFITPKAAGLTDEERAALVAAFADNAIFAELAGAGLEPKTEADLTDALLDALTNPDSKFENLRAQLLLTADKLAERLDERRDMRRMAAAIERHYTCAVELVDPTTDRDLAHCEIVFLDYYLQGTNSAHKGELAEAWATRLRQARRVGGQLIVLMSSNPNVRAFKTDFRTKTELKGGAFIFVSKPEMDAAWKVKAHLTMLADALPHSTALDAYVSAIGGELDKAKAALVELLNRLDIPDFAFIQNLALQRDGQPLGEYLSWLLSAHLASRAFESGMRAQQGGVDTVVFSKLLMAPAAPSLDVAELYHSAQFARNVGALGKHPRDRTEAPNVPFLQLGDFFIREDRAKAYVVLSADCDLAFTPDMPDRRPDGTRSIILVPGTPVHIALAKHKQNNEGATAAFSDAGATYQIDWDFDHFASVALADVPNFLVRAGCKIEQHERLRPLYALKLQQEFGARMLRVGAPVVPPVMWQVRAQLVQPLGGSLTILHSFDLGDVVVSAMKNDHRVHLSAEVTSQINRAMIEAAERAEAAVAKLVADGHGGQPLQQLKDAVGLLKRAVDDDDFWATLLVQPRELPAAGKVGKTGDALCVAHSADEAALKSNRAILFLHVDPPVQEAKVAATVEA
jgi:hypothetical protein